jgi:hypothetical protein
MFKPLTLSLSLAVALGACSVSMAGIFASSQCATPQSPCASSQSCLPSAQSCLPKKHWNFHLPKPCFTYEWVLKKKMVWSCGNSGCNTCPMPSSQCGPSSQILGSGQAFPTTYGSGQVYGGMYGSGAMTATAPAGVMTAAPTGDEAPPAPEVAPAVPAVPGVPEVPGAPAAPAPPAPSAPGPQSSLLFSTPSGN